MLTEHPEEVASKQGLTEGHIGLFSNGDTPIRAAIVIVCILFLKRKLMIYTPSTLICSLLKYSFLNQHCYTVSYSKQTHKNEEG